MKKVLFIITMFFMVNLFLSGAIIEKIVLEGNKKVSKDTVLFYMKSHENGDFSKNSLKKDFKALWETGFFENIEIKAEDGSNGKIVKVIVKENPLIASVTYKTGKKIKKDDIQEKMRENNVSLMAFSHYSPSKLKKVEKIIRDMLLEKGYNQGKVNVVSKDEKGQVALTVNVVQGPKTRIGTVEFPGLDSKKVSAAFLRRGMKNNQAHSLISTISSKDTLNKDKMDEDLEEVKLRLQQKGYLEAKVGQPTFSMFKKKQVFGKERQMLKITVPVELGPQYRVGEVKFEGNKVMKSNILKRFVTLKKGAIYDIKKRNKIKEELQKGYSSMGYAYCQIAPVENLDPEKKVADLTFRIVENDIVYLGKLEFVGNTFTKDHVLRREWFLREGHRFNANAIEDSVRRMKQLGLVTIEKIPDIKPDPDDPQKLNMKVEVQELNRNMINFNVGYSGYDGWFVALGYQTQNFLGLGETFALNFQSGTRAKNYRLAFSEPRVFNTFASLGIDLHKTAFRYPSLYTRNGQGFNISSGFRFWRYWGFSLIFSYEMIEVSDVNEDINWSNPYSYYYYTEGRRAIASLAPTLYYSTIDSPLFPTSGVRYLLNYRYSGGFLGGDIFMHKVKLEYIKFIPLFKYKNFLGFHAVFQKMFPFGGKEIPFYERYYLGGERSIRGFDIYRIGPQDDSGFITGGTGSFFMNFEYRIPINQQFSFVFFYDVGNAYDGDFDLKDVYQSMGLELKVFVPMLGVPFRLIFAYNPRIVHDDDSHFAFRFAVGPSF
ncbi:MAG: outer membrane protein assembly factor BamA [Candidatus Aminicenantes bacterium]|nr:outer membrane protein assembly factor BamA [Candidatus Aminicenantes bacterium]